MLKASISFARKSVDIAKPSAKVDPPPSASFARQCKN